jgi:hypothetical protein
MRKRILFFLLVISALGLFNIESHAFETKSCSAPTLTSSYGLYGKVTYPGNAVVVSPIVYIYRYQNGSYQYYGQTRASACGYYTFDTGRTGQYRVIVRGKYSLKYAPCGSIFAIEPVAGDIFGTVSYINPQRLLNVPTA